MTIIHTIRCGVISLILVLGWLSAASVAMEVGAPADVAPQVENTRLQKWPRAAWSAESRRWLVVWREGDLNEQETDIWCARIAEDGAILDPAGIRITSAKGIQDRPVVAASGKDFLVAWQDLRNEKDTSTGSTGSPQAGSAQGWDVYAARVTGDGKVVEKDGFLIDGRPHNQCMPSIAGMEKNFYVAWQAWVKDGAAPGYGSYEVRGTRVSPDGRAQDLEGIPLVESTALQPSLAFHETAGLVMVVIGRTEKRLRSPGGFVNKPGLLRIDPDKGTPLGAVTYLPANKTTWDKNYVPGIALMEDGSTLVTVMGWRGGMTLFRFDKEGQRAGEFLRFHDDLKNQCIAPISSIAFDGKRCLMTYDFPTAKKTPKKRPWRMKVWGWMISPDGAVMEGGKSGVAIAGGDNVCCMQAVPCAGPEGTFLVVYAEARGVEDTKLVMRIVK